MRFDFHTPEFAITQFEIVHHDIQCGQGTGLLVQQGLKLRGGTLGQFHARQTGKQAARRVVTGTCLPVFDIAIEFAGVQVGTPGGTVARAPHHHVVQCAPLHGERMGTHGNGGGQIVLRHARRRAVWPDSDGGGCRGCFGDGGLCQHLFPGIHIHLLCTNVGRHAVHRHG
ncbi:MAG: hypothetical protein ACD_23C00409G0001, partial [uncultured bacterium]